MAPQARGWKRDQRPSPDPESEVTPHPKGLRPAPEVVPWALVGPAKFVGYDDPRAVRAKVAFAKKAGLAGVFAWELSQDNGEILDAMQP